MQSYLAGGCGTLNIGLGEINPTIDSRIVYPNPANSFITIPVDNCKLFIYDVFGKAILIQQIENKRSVDVSELPNGIYFTEIQTNSGKYSQKVIIQH
ncbi:MAG: T9SS type A sorting domain-containing protein [Bacteroidia bacterium]|nr:T9SS type A sorting domain-containing protein [Bacteroidia bacterium]